MLIIAVNLSIRALQEKDMEEGLSLVWDVFQEFEMPDYGREGTEQFYKSIHDADFLAKVHVLGAFQDEKLVGIIASRNEGSHIALFFVDGKYHRQGIGKRLFQSLLKECRSQRITVNSSPYAVPFYRKLGFHEIGEEQIKNGIIFTPMEMNFALPPYNEEQ